MEISNVDYNVLQRLEEDLWKADTRFDQSYMEGVFAPDFFEFGRSGQIHTRESCISHTEGELDALIPLQNLQVRLLAPNVAQVTYNSQVNYGDTVEKGRRSSIWTRHKKSWKLRFHQGTAF